MTIIAYPGSPWLLAHALRDDDRIAACELLPEEAAQLKANFARDPRVALSILDPENPYRYLEIRGRVVEITEQGADDHINRMAKKYLDKDIYPFRKPDEVRVIYKVEPQRVLTYGG